MIISLMTEKGGAGKTTLATNIAYGIKQRKHRVLLVDADRQASARDWHVANNGELLDVIGLDLPTIDRDIKPFTKDYDFIFVDGAPRLDIIAAKMVVCSDIILIPVRPSPYDVWATKATVDLVKQRQEITNGKQPYAAFVISSQIFNTKICREVKQALDEYELPILNCGTYQRVAYPETAKNGRTVVDAAEYTNARLEIRYLIDEILQLCEGIRPHA